MDEKYGLKTIAIAIVLSVILSTTISYMMLNLPQIQDALRGPRGEPGLQGVQGLQGSIGLPGLGLGELIYDSGWIAIDQDEYLVICTLDDPNVFVYMTGKTQPGSIHQRHFGGEYYYSWNWTTWTPTWTPMGVNWHVAWSGKYPGFYELGVYRNSHDWKWEEVRVMVWQLPS